MDHNDNAFRHITEGAIAFRADDTDASAQTVLRSHGDFVAYVLDDLKYRVEVARSMGLSWSDVGDALGMSKQAAWERFGRDSERVNI